MYLQCNLLNSSMQLYYSAQKGTVFITFIVRHARPLFLIHACIYGSGFNCIPAADDNGYIQCHMQVEVYIMQRSIRPSQM